MVAGGRDARYSGESHPRGGDLRTPWQTDRDRVLYSAYLRRLAAITQVIPAGAGPGFHNRLTHSLKVAQIGRRLSEYLLLKTERRTLDAAGGLEPDVVETACLIHDLGHPPFGHNAEEELDACLRRAHESDGYEGNAQSFRLITRLASTRRGEGLDLTRATLNAVLKYPWHRHPGKGERSRKFGYYSSERDFFEFARAGAVGDRRSLEACIMDHADDVTYSVHDVEDFYRAGVIPLDQLLQPTEARSVFLDARVVTTLLRKHEVDRADAERFLDQFGTHCRSLRLPFGQESSQIRQLDHFVSFLITRFLLVERIPAMKTDPIHVDPEASGDALVVPKEVLVEIGLLKAMMEHYVFHSPRLLAMQRGQRRLVRELFDELVDADAHGARDLLPPYFRERFEAIDAGSEHDSAARLAADVIASLSETEAVRLHASLKGAPTEGAVAFG